MRNILPIRLNTAEYAKNVAIFCAETVVFG